MDAVAAKARGDSLEAQIYRAVPAIVDGVMDEILARWPKHWRRASGYNLDRLAAALLPADQRSRLSFDSRFRPPVADPTLIDRFNLAQILTGSEGTLAVMTAATVNLVPKPTADRAGRDPLRQSGRGVLRPSPTFWRPTPARPNCSTSSSWIWRARSLSGPSDSISSRAIPRR